MEKNSEGSASVDPGRDQTRTHRLDKGIPPPSEMEAPGGHLPSTWSPVFAGSPHALWAGAGTHAAQSLAFMG